MPRNIFISYRRDDSEGEAGRLFDDLTRSFGENSVFMDVSAIAPGVDFRQAIDENIASCGVLLALIGPSWASIKNKAGLRRLDDANDLVRLEIASALRRNIAVIPVLVHEAKMPSPDELPEDVKNLAFHNSVEITHVRWNSDVALLIDALQPYVTSTRTGGSRPVHATVPVQLPAPYPGPNEVEPIRRSRLPLIAGVSVAAVVAVIALWVKFAPSRNNPADQPSTATPASAPAQTDSGSHAPQASSGSKAPQAASGLKPAILPAGTPPQPAPVTTPATPPQGAGGAGQPKIANEDISQLLAGAHHLTTLLMAPNGKCLESWDGSGPSRMDPCGNYSGQLWTMIPAGNGYYRLQSQFMQPKNKCLESGNGQGPSHMDPCANVSGQVWRVEPTQDGCYRLKSMFMEPQNKCLESGNGTGPPRMDPCGDSTGQLWKIVGQ
jgi:hypothetical protein